MMTHIVFFIAFLSLCVSHAAFLFIGWHFGTKASHDKVLMSNKSKGNSNPVHDGLDMFDEERLDFE